MSLNVVCFPLFWFLGKWVGFVFIGFCLCDLSFSYIGCVLILNLKKWVSLNVGCFLFFWFVAKWVGFVLFHLCFVVSRMDFIWIWRKWHRVVLFFILLILLCDLSFSCIGFVSNFWILKNVCIIGNGYLSIWFLFNCFIFFWSYGKWISFDLVSIMFTCFKALVYDFTERAILGAFNLNLKIFLYHGDWVSPSVEMGWFRFGLLLFSCFE